VVSFNAKHEITYTLYSQEGGKSEAVVDSGVLIAKKDVTGTEEQTENFVIRGVTNGTYKLVISKAAHADYVILNLVVNNADVHLEDDARAGVNLITLGVGDINGDGFINDTDQSIMLSKDNYSCDGITTDEQRLCDLNGDGYVNDTDQSILLRADNYSRSTTEDFTIDLSILK
jgi:hypothetical protein